MEGYIRKIKDLLSELVILSVHPHEPIEVLFLPKPWKLEGKGNYAAVLSHPEYTDLVVKVYAPGRPGILQEIQVYKTLGKHPLFSECYYYGDNFLVLKKLEGITLFECINKGILIPEQVIKDVDASLEYACRQGLYPHDVHGKNVMLLNGRGIVVDVSDFSKEGYCPKWDDLKKAYYKIYVPIFLRLKLKLPYFVLNFVRKAYRLYRKVVKVEHPHASKAPPLS